MNTQISQQRAEAKLLKAQIKKLKLAIQQRLAANKKKELAIERERLAAIRKQEAYIARRINRAKNSALTGFRHLIKQCNIIEVDPSKADKKTRTRKAKIASTIKSCLRKYIGVGDRSLGDS